MTHFDVETVPPSGTGGTVRYFADLDTARASLGADASRYPEDEPPEWPGVYESYLCGVDDSATIVECDNPNHCTCPPPKFGGTVIWCACRGWIE